MDRMIFQVAVGEQSKLYEHCIQSVRNYCEKHDITHHILHTPKLWIKPDPFNSGRSEESHSRVGCLPIYEKENALEYIDDFDQIAIIDADIYIRPDSPNIFDEVSEDAAFGAVI